MISRTINRIMEKLLARFLLLCSVFSGVTLGFSPVPVLLWRDSIVPTVFKPALAGHTLSSKQFESRYLETVFHSEASSIVIFTQNELSLEDFTKYGNVYSSGDSDVFKNVKKYMMEPSSISIPAVVSPLRDIQFWIKQFQGTVTRVNSEDEAAKLRLQSGRNLIIVTLPSGQGSRSDELTTNDKVVGTVIGIVGSNFVALYTGQQPSDLYYFPESEFSGRHLLAVDETADTNQTYTLINKTGCPLVYFTELQLMYRDNTADLNCAVKVPNFILNDNVKCSNDSGAIKTMDVSYTTGEKPSLAINLKFSFTLAIHFWTSKLNVTVKGTCPNSTKSIDKEFEMRTLPFEAPEDFSYHCNAVPTLMSTPNERFKLNLELKNFQIQPFNVKDFKFGRPNECIGFFTIPIFMGLLVALVLLIITLFGVCMLSDIKTNDQFDDPKGKTITVEVKEGN